MDSTPVGGGNRLVTGMVASELVGDHPGHPVEGQPGVAQKEVCAVGRRVATSSILSVSHPLRGENSKRQSGLLWDDPIAEHFEFCGAG